MDQADTSSTKLTSAVHGVSVQRLNMREIARLARVSTATVSRAINRIPTVNPYLAKRVWKVVQDLGYYPNIQARALVSGQSRTFGVVVPQLTHPFFAEVVQAFENIAVEHGYEILLTSIHDGSWDMELIARRMIERRVDGVAVLTFGIEEPVIRDLVSHGISLVAIDCASQMPGVSNIRIDYENGIRQAVQHLAALRHVRIAFVAGPAHLACAQVQMRAFQKAMIEIGLELPQELMLAGDHSVESGKKTFDELWSLPAPPTAILCSNDMTAIGVLVQAYENGVRVPDQLSVVGFDNVEPARFSVPPLTTVQVSQTELATQAFQMLADGGKMSGSPKNREYKIKTALVLRRSTALRCHNRELSAGLQGRWGAKAH